MVLVSSFSALPPTRSLKQSHRNGVSSLKKPLVTENSHRQLIFARSTSRRSRVLSMTSPVTATEDCEEVRELFSKYCDENFLIDRKTLASMPPIVDMLADEDLLPVELNEIWEAAPKSANDASRVDVDSFLQIYRDVDDLFEDDDDDEEGDDEISGEVSDADNTPAADANDNGLDEELSKAYDSLCDDNGLISKDKMMQWEEIESLFEEGLLGEDEFEELWKNSVDGENDSVDANGFSNFNLGLDDLFVLEDDDDDEEEELSVTTTGPRSLVVEGDMPPGVLFSQLADTKYLVGTKELNLWVELNDLLEDGELLASELQEMYEKYAAPDGKLTEDGFLQLYDEIDGLFEDDDDDEDGEETVVTSSPPKQQEQQQNPPVNTRVKEDFLSFLDIVVEEDEQPCGFGASESDQEQILNILQVLEQQPTNMILQKDGNIEQADLAGMWELVYTSSSAMKFNKGLSGIGGSFPNGRFDGLRQELIATKFLTDVVYKERIEVTPSSASFDVTVKGVWDLRKSVSLFTGQPTVILNIEPDRVTYGPTSTRADHWKSLGPVNRLDLSYLDDNLRVMRGCTSSETLLIFKKVN